MHRISGHHLEHMSDGTVSQTFLGCLQKQLVFISKRALTFKFSCNLKMIKGSSYHIFCRSPDQPAGPCGLIRTFTVSFIQNYYILVNIWINHEGLIRPHTVFDPITSHTLISAQSSNFVVFRLQDMYLLLYKIICC